MSAALATGLPPGWIELAAHQSDDGLRAYLDAQAKADGDPYTPEQSAMLVDACVRGRQVLAGMSWQHFGAVVTSAASEVVEDEDAEVGWLPTVWAFGVGLLNIPPTNDINPIGMAQRVLGRLATVEEVAPFRLDDGRDGVAMTLKAEAEMDPSQPDPTTALPQLDVKKLGVWACLLPVPGLPESLSLTVGVAPNTIERLAMSYVAGQIASSVHWVQDTTELVDEPIIIDTTGSLLPGGFPQPRPNTGSTA